MGDSGPQVNESTCVKDQEARRVRGRGVREPPSPLQDFQSTVWPPLGVETVSDMKLEFKAGLVLGVHWKD